MICGRSFFWLVAVMGTADAFPTPLPSSRKRMSSSSSFTALQMSDATGWDNFCVENLDKVDFAPEEARRFRRTVYTHDDWKKHRSQDRFLVYLGSLFSSGTFRNSEREVIVCTMLASLVCVYNALVGGYTDLVGIQHGPLIPGVVVGIPMTAFTITSSSLGLLLSESFLSALSLCMGRLKRHVFCGL